MDWSMKQGTLAIGKKVNILGTPARNRSKTMRSKHMVRDVRSVCGLQEDLRTFFDR